MPLPVEPTPTEAQNTDVIDASLNKEIERDLKSLNEPIRLFGESDRQRISRLRLLQLRKEEQGDGQRNDFYELLEKQDDETGEGDASAKRVKSTSLQTISQIEPINRGTLTADRTRTRQLLGLFIKTLLSEWESDLQGRPEDVKRSTAGRVATATHQQAGDYLKPFFRLLKRDELAGDILAHLVDIVSCLQDREYVRANDTYLRLSIGNAPWPIGVTMVGIHERSAHEKITSTSVAHVLNDEVSRKWIQSIKRLMTFCQKRYPPSDLSKAMG